MAENITVHTALARNEVNSIYNSRPGQFVHSVYFQAQEPFILEEHIITYGPHAGRRAYVAVKATHFPFMKLPLELRQSIYKMVFGTEATIKITARRMKRARGDCSDTETLAKVLSSRCTSLGVPVPKLAARADACSLLLTTRAISAEAKEFLYQGRRFTFPGIAIMLGWLSDINENKKYVTHITCEKSGHRLTRDCYSQLVGTVRLRYFKINLPLTFNGTLREHMDKHYEDLRLYLLARGADEAESRRRLDHIHFDIGPERRGVRDMSGIVLRQMTPDIERECKVFIRAKLQKHFKKS